MQQHILEKSFSTSQTYKSSKPGKSVCRSGEYSPHYLQGKRIELSQQFWTQDSNGRCSITTPQAMQGPRNTSILYRLCRSNSSKIEAETGSSGYTKDGSVRPQA
jgi:hypothetical protein